MFLAIEKIWYSKSKLKWLLWPLHLFFYYMVWFKRFLYQSNIISNQKFSKPVIVVGNLSVGGTGKTPFISQLAKVCFNKGIKVGIVSRGYLAQTTQFPHQVSYDDDALSVGDEAYMQFKKLKAFDVPLVIDPDRARGVNYLINNNQVDLVISDDGLQHYNMSRDIEILLFEQQRQFGNQLVLPFGPLREPMSRLTTVDLLVQNGSSNNQFSKSLAILTPTKFVNLKSGKEYSTDLFSKQQKKTNAVAAIGNPKRFLDSLRSVAEVGSTKFLIDHHQFQLDDFNEFKDQIVVMTEKDAVKCYPFAKENWYYLAVEMEFNQHLCEKLDFYITTAINRS